MIDALKVTGYRDIKQITLNNLGRINVICGKNSSGKSTVLNAFTINNSNDTKILRGINLSLHYSKELIDYMAKTIGVVYSDVDNVQACFDVFKETADDKPCWYEDDAIDFQERFNNIWTQYYRIPAPDSLNAFKSTFNNSLRPIMIPPKRSLDTEATTQAIGVHSTGKNILGNLFKSKNSIDDRALKGYFDKMRSAFRFITDGTNFDIDMNNEKSIKLKLHINQNSTWVDAAQSGLGFQDLIVILYFSFFSSENFLIIEEPENHLHPDIQRRLLAYLKKEIKDKQFLFSTHSNVFLDSLYVDRVYLTKYTDSQITLTDETQKSTILSELGYSINDNLTSDMIVLVEGPSDVPVLKQFLNKMGILDRYNIKFWPLGGDIMAQVDIEVFKQNYNIIALIDRDDGSNSVRQKFAEKCKALSIHCHRLEKYAIENYFTVDALRKVFGAQISEEFQSINPDEKLEDQLGIDVKARTNNIAKQMEVSDIEGTDLHDFLLEIDKMLNN